MALEGALVPYYNAASLLAKPQYCSPLSQHPHLLWLPWRNRVDLVGVLPLSVHPWQPTY